MDTDLMSPRNDPTQRRYPGAAARMVAAQRTAKLLQQQADLSARACTQAVLRGDSANARANATRYQTLMDRAAQVLTDAATRTAP